MKVMFAGFVASVLIAVAAWYGLNNAGFSTQQTYTSPNVRLN